MTTRTTIAAALLVFAPLLARANTELTVKSERSSVPVKGLQTQTGEKQPPANQTIHHARYALDRVGGWQQSRRL